MEVDVRKLQNGITVIMENIEGVNTVSLGYFVKVGSKYEKPIEEGVSHFIEHMLFKGTTNRTSKDISEEIDNEGGMINAYTTKETTVYYVQLLADSLYKGIDILSDMFINSTFTEENLDKERNVIIEEIRMYEDIPEEVAHEENAKFAINGPQGKSILGTEMSLKNINRDIMVNYFDETYNPESIVISLAGKIDKEKAFEKLNNTIGNFKRNYSKREISREFTLNSGENIIKKEEANQVHLCFNTLGVSSKDKNRYSLSMISNVLGGNMSSRLFQKVREEKGLAYSIYSYNSSGEEGGLFTIYAGTTKNDYKEVLNIIKKEIEDIKNNGITEYELQKAKNQFLSMITFGLESTKGRMNRIASSYMMYGEVKPIEETIKEIEGVTIEDIKRTAEIVFDEKYYSQTIVGDI